MRRFPAWLTESVRLIFLIGLLAPVALASSEDDFARDPHYSAVGFFDMHICNWPERPPFVMLLFSTSDFANITRIEVNDPAARTFHVFDTTRFRVVRPKNKPAKRVFINEVDLPESMTDGWYRARITMRDGTVHAVRDYVVVRKLPWTRVIVPQPNAKNVPLPVTLRWQPVPGAQFYRVFIRDLWDDEKVIYESGPLAKPELRVPDGTLARGGLYRWRVHARDVNEHVLLGDFNHGSQSEPAEFTVAMD